MVRSQFVEKKGVPTLIAVDNDATGKAKQTALAWAKGIGGTVRVCSKPTSARNSDRSLGSSAFSVGGPPLL